MRKVSQEPDTLGLSSETHTKVKEKTDSRKLSPDPPHPCFTMHQPKGTSHSPIINQLKFKKELPEPDTNLLHACLSHKDYLS